MTLAAFMIMAAELYFTMRLISRYSPEFDLDLFMCRAPLDQVMMLRHHASTFIVMLQMTTILATMRTAS